ncbi:MAG: hypothetical protein KBC73_16945 [Burkholderiaceae bacterium]|nr:hypothetical protein [Burkholderiaceae bacterium]
MSTAPWRRDAFAYPWSAPLAPRWSDCDTLRHLNNVALIGLHAEARQQWLAEVLGLSGVNADEPVLRAAELATDFLAQGAYPEPLQATLRLLPPPGGVEPGSGWRLATALFQQRQCIGLQRVRLAAFDAPGGAPQPLPPALHARLQAQLARQMPLSPTQAASEQEPETGDDLGALLDQQPPRWLTLQTRYRDLDAHQGLSEATLASLVEHTRLQLLHPALAQARAEDPTSPGPLNFLVVHARLQVLAQGRLHDTGAGELAVGGAVGHIGRSAVRLYSWIAPSPEDQPLALAETVLVHVDGAGRPAPLPEATRSAFQDWSPRPR